MEVALEADPESEPGSQACRLLLNISLLPRCSPPLPRCCRRRLPQGVTHHRASGAMVRRCGPRATKHAVPTVAMSLRDTMGPVRDTARACQCSHHLGMALPQMRAGIALAQIVEQGDDVARPHCLGHGVDPLHVGAGGLTDEKATAGEAPAHVVGCFDGHIDTVINYTLIQDGRDNRIRTA